jgi:hypothetical protein
VIEAVADEANVMVSVALLSVAAVKLKAEDADDNADKKLTMEDEPLVRVPVEAARTAVVTGAWNVKHADVADTVVLERMTLMEVPVEKSASICCVAVSEQLDA